jgi:hypothetical protein
VVVAAHHDRSWVKPYAKSARWTIVNEGTTGYISDDDSKVYGLDSVGELVAYLKSGIAVVVRN